MFRVHLSRQSKRQTSYELFKDLCACSGLDFTQVCRFEVPRPAVPSIILSYDIIRVCLIHVILVFCRAVVTLSLCVHVDNALMAAQLVS